METKREVFYYLEDERSDAAKLHEAAEIDQLSKYNNKIIIKPPNEDKHLCRILPHIIKKVQFSDGWYVKYTDNLGSHSFFESPSTILTIHGCPGYYYDWTRLEKCLGNNFCRFINFFIPGFDGESEIRGNYDGSARDMSLLMVRLLDYLKIGKFILLHHSLGGFYAYYFSNFFGERLQGLIYMAAPPICWYVGYKTFYYFNAVDNGLNIKRKVNEEKWENTNWDNFNNEEFRNKLEAFNNNKMKDIYFEGNVKFPFLSASEIIAYVKLTTSLENTSDFFKYARSMPKIPKLLICGRTDPIAELSLYQKSFFFYVFGPGKVDFIKIYGKEVIKQTKHRLMHGQGFQNFHWGDIQSNFLHTFDNTGHNVHKKRAQELSIPIRRYVKFLDCVQDLISTPIPKF